MRAHPEPIGRYAPLARSPFVRPSTVTSVLFVVPERDRPLYAGGQFTPYFAHTAADALRMIATSKPRLVVLEWDDDSLGGREICGGVSASATSVLVMTAAVANVPAILKAGCQGVLLKPFAPNLLAGRIGRVLKETERHGLERARVGAQTGTNRVWSDLACPNCGARGVTSFDFSSYRRMWYACVSCDATWLGPRRE